MFDTLLTVVGSTIRQLHVNVDVIPTYVGSTRCQHLVMADPKLTHHAMVDLLFNYPEVRYAHSGQCLGAPGGWWVRRPRDLAAHG
jgi:hypothetical protein